MPRYRGVFLIVALALASGCAHRDPPATAQASPSPSASPAPAPSTSPSPQTTPTTLATSPPAIAPTLSPSPSPTPASLLFLPAPFNVVPNGQAPTLAPLVPVAPELSRTPPPVTELAPDAAPEILAVEIPSQTVVGGETVIGTVIASSNVASVEVRVAGYSRSMDKIGEGQFTISVTVPRLPLLLRNRTYTLQIIARNTRGDAVAQALPITVR